MDDSTNRSQPTGYPNASASRQSDDDTSRPPRLNKGKQRAVSPRNDQQTPEAKAAQEHSFENWGWSTPRQDFPRQPESPSKSPRSCAVRTENTVPDPVAQRSRDDPQPLNLPPRPEPVHRPRERHDLVQAPNGAWILTSVPLRDERGVERWVVRNTFNREEERPIYGIHRTGPNERRMSISEHIDPPTQELLHWSREQDLKTQKLLDEDEKERGKARKARKALGEKCTIF